MLTLDMAATRSLGGAASPGRATAPNDGPRISDALHAPGFGNRNHAIQIIDLALAN